MVYERKKFIKTKYRIWLNHAALGKALFKVSLIHGILTTLFGVQFIISGSYFVGFVLLAMASNLWLIVYSRVKFLKINKDLSEKSDKLDDIKLYKDG